MEPPSHRVEGESVRFLKLLELVLPSLLPVERDDDEGYETAGGG